MDMGVDHIVDLHSAVFGRAQTEHNDGGALDGLTGRDSLAPEITFEVLGSSAVSGSEPPFSIAAV